MALPGDVTYFHFSLDLYLRSDRKLCLAKVADPETVQGVCLNPTLSPYYFTFMGNFENSWVN